MTIGQRIREARIKAGLTQAELAEKLGISYVGVSQWERDIRNPKIETVRKIADALGMKLSELMGMAAPESNEKNAAADSTERKCKIKPETYDFFNEWVHFQGKLLDAVSEEEKKQLYASIPAGKIRIYNYYARLFTSFVELDKADQEKVRSYMSFLVSDSRFVLDIEKWETEGPEFDDVLEGSDKV